MNRRFSTSNCPTAEMAWTNFELRREVNKEVRINIENEAKIKRLEKQLARYEDEITYLNNLIEKFESRENDNKEELSRLQFELRKSNTLCEKKEEYILFQESHLLESQETINKLKERIGTMAQSSTSLQRRIQPPNPGEHNNEFDAINDGCRDIDDFIQERPEAQSMTKADVVSKLNYIVDRAQRLCDIAELGEREKSRSSQTIHRLNNQVTQLQAQLQQNGQTFNQLNNQVTQLQAQLQQIALAYAQTRNDLNIANNNFNTLNHAHAIQGQNLQNAQLWNIKYRKWKRKAKSPNNIIWLVNTPN
jgi:chromosome segregation ATPase